MTTRTRKTIVAGAIGLVVLLPGASVAAYPGDPRGPDPPSQETYHHDDGRCYDDANGGYHHGYDHGPGGYHEGHQDPGGWHHGAGR